MSDFKAKYILANAIAKAVTKIDIPDQDEKVQQLQYWDGKR